ncbi:hypothetical protein FRC01_013221 [Tulasnella sp. 417]|nr:hypothetical protein FRC01_013221 [Tulasnella sp. 417]
MGTHIDPACSSWPADGLEKRLVFVDLEMPDQTGAYYIGAYTRHPKKRDGFLDTDQFRNLPKRIQLEVAGLWAPAGATLTQRLNAVHSIEDGLLLVPYLHFQKVQEDMILDIDNLLLDAIRRDYPTVGRWDLRPDGRPYPEGQEKKHYLDLKERAVSKERSAKELSERVNEAASRQFDLADEIRRLRGILATQDGSSLHLSQGKRSSTAMLSHAEFEHAHLLTAAAPPLSNRSEYSSAEQSQPPPSANNVSESSVITIPPVPIPLQGYAILAPIAPAFRDGIPFALMNCGYMPKRMVRCVRAAIPPPPPAGTSTQDAVPRRCFTIPLHTVIWIDPPESPLHRSRGLLLQKPVVAGTEWKPAELDGGPWKYGQQKYLLELFDCTPYDGTTWHGLYERVPLPSSTAFLESEALESIPLQTRRILSQSVPSWMREALKEQVDEKLASALERQKSRANIPGGLDAEDDDADDSELVTSLATQLDDVVWREIIQSGVVKIPAALVTFRSPGLEVLQACRIVQQGPGYHQTLFALEPDGDPHLPKRGHEDILKRMSHAEDLLDIEAKNMAEMEGCLERLSLQRDGLREAIRESSAAASKKQRSGEGGEVFSLVDHPKDAPSPWSAQQAETRRLGYLPALPPSQPFPPSPGRGHAEE